MRIATLILSMLLFCDHSFTEARQRNPDTRDLRLQSLLAELQDVIERYEQPQTSRRLPIVAQNARPITLTVRNADARDVLRLLAERGGFEVQLIADTKGIVPITLMLVKANIHDAFREVADLAGYEYSAVGAKTIALVRK